MHQELITNNINYINEANIILNELDLLKYISKLGETFITGSLFLELMVWRDLDLYVDYENVNMSKIYDLIPEICKTFKPFWCEFKDTTDFNDGSPKGYFLGFETKVIKNEVWNIDIWFINKNEITNSNAYMQKLKQSLTSDNKLKILDIKSKVYKDYMSKNISSLDVYESVINSNIQNEEEFWNLIKQRNKQPLL